MMYASAPTTGFASESVAQLEYFGDSMEERDPLASAIIQATTIGLSSLPHSLAIFRLKSLDVGPPFFG